MAAGEGATAAEVIRWFFPLPHVSETAAPADAGNLLNARPATAAAAAAERVRCNVCFYEFERDKTTGMKINRAAIFRV